ncbi:hypothetical protein C8R44DRAFT_866933 [Mycena epipterygia]|nr:hypothetical protein C8R44DRAFT_866933 [Mycena epipterygia]
MNQCLGIREVVEMICSQLDPALGKTDSAALASLARTSHLFSNPALDVLWEKQCTLLNLCQTFPSDLFYTVLQGELGVRIRELNRPVVATDWIRPLQYTPRIKCLANPRVDYTVDKRILSGLDLSNPNDWLLPNLQTLEWVPKSSDFPIQLLLTPGLKRLSFPSMNNCAHLSLLATLQRRCAKLEDITISLESSYASDYPAPGPTISLFILSLRNIRSLDIEIPDVPSFEHLARLSMLTSLKVRNLRHLLSEALSSPPSRPTFSNLRELTISGSHTQLVAQLLQYTHRSPLSRVYLALTCQTQGERPDADFMRHLLPFHNMTSLHISSRVGFNLNDDDLEQMGREWPQLESLRLTAPHLSWPSPLTLRSLQVLARHCPRLRELTLPFEVGTIPAAPATDHVAHTNLAILGVCTAVGETRPGPLAKFLVQLFPRLSRMLVFQDLGEVPAQSQIDWKIVEGVVEAIVGLFAQAESGAVTDGLSVLDQ